MGDKKVTINQEKKTGNSYVWFIFLHIALLIYSTCGIFSKMASRQSFLSREFILYYAGMILILGIYAVCWQQVLKHLPITTAYANKAVTVVWGIILGFLVFQESVSVKQIVGAVIIIIGAVLYVISDRADGSDSEERKSEP